MTIFNTLMLGVEQTITQDTVYALPARQCFIQAGAVVQTSLDNSTWGNLANSNLGVAVTSVFVRCHTGDTTCVVKV